MVDRLLSLDVDAVLIIGDMVDGPVEDIANRVSPISLVLLCCIKNYTLRQLPHRFPTFFVTGNHEYYYGDVMKWVNMYKNMGIHVLNNKYVCFTFIIYCFSHTLFRGICLAGVNDISSGKMG